MLFAMPPLHLQKNLFFGVRLTKSNPIIICGLSYLVVKRSQIVEKDEHDGKLRNYYK